MQSQLPIKHPRILPGKRDSVVHEFDAFLSAGHSAVSVVVEVGYRQVKEHRLAACELVQHVLVHRSGDSSQFIVDCPHEFLELINAVVVVVVDVLNLPLVPLRRVGEDGVGGFWRCQGELLGLLSLGLELAGLADCRQHLRRYPVREGVGFRLVAAEGELVDGGFGDCPNWLICFEYVVIQHIAP